MTDTTSAMSNSGFDAWLEVQRVLSEYCNAVDQSRFDDFEKLFAEDAIVTARLAGTTYRGPSEIRSYLETQPLGMRGLHATVNPDIQIEGSDATARSAFFLLVPRNGTIVVGAWGWYRDHLVCDHAQKRWLFTERRIETQWRLTDSDPAS